jgi:hypothetical protein
VAQHAAELCVGSQATPHQCWVWAAVAWGWRRLERERPRSDSPQFQVVNIPTGTTHLIVRVAQPITMTSDPIGNECTRLVNRCRRAAHPRGRLLAAHRPVLYSGHHIQDVRPECQLLTTPDAHVCK